MVTVVIPRCLGSSCGVLSRLIGNFKKSIQRNGQFFFLKHSDLVCVVPLLATVKTLICFSMLATEQTSPPFLFEACLLACGESASCSLTAVRHPAGVPAVSPQWCDPPGNISDQHLVNLTFYNIDNWCQCQCVHWLSFFCLSCYDFIITVNEIRQGIGVVVVTSHILKVPGLKLSFGPSFAGLRILDLHGSAPNTRAASTFQKHASYSWILIYVLQFFFKDFLFKVKCYVWVFDIFFFLSTGT